MPKNSSPLYPSTSIALGIAWAELLAHPLRTFVVSLTMMLAVALALLPGAIIEGTRGTALTRATELKTDLIHVTTSRASALAAKAFIVESDLPALTELSLPISAYRVESARLRGVSSPLWLIGCDAQSAALRQTRLLQGRWPNWEPPGVRGADQVEIVLEQELAKAICLSAETTEISSLIGQVFQLRWPGPARDLRIAMPVVELLAAADPRIAQQAQDSRRAQLTVVGIASDESSASVDRFGYEKGRALSDLVEEVLETFGMAPKPAPWQKDGMGIYLPRRQLPGVRLDWLILRAPPLEITEYSNRIEAALVERGREALVYTNALLPLLVEPELDGYLVLHDVLFYVFVILGLVQLAIVMQLVGWRRRKEIAIRRAFGASRADIFLQFMLEGSLIGLCGWLGGVVLGMALAYLRVELDPNVAMAVTVPWGDVADLSIILTVGALLASSLPAWLATLVEPMTLLRKA